MKYQCIVVGPISTNCYIFWCEDTKKAAVIDPGFETEKILRVIEEEGLDVIYVILTHGHFDHVSAAAEVKEATGAKLLIHRDEADFLKDGAKSMGGAYGASSAPLEPDILLEDGEIINVGELKCRVLSTPGHTRGSICILCGDVMFSGDTLFYLECGRCDLPTGSYPAMLSSLARLARLGGNYTVLPGHDRSTDLDFERVNNPYIKEGRGLLI